MFPDFHLSGISQPATFDQTRRATPKNGPLGSRVPAGFQDASALENVELWSIFGIPCSSAAEAGGPEAEAHLCRCLGE
jgi:hypothetical protein